MPRQELLRALLALAEALGIEVRKEPFQRRALAAGGLCSLRGQRVILIDANAPAVDRVAALADALSRLDLSAVELDPKVTLALADCRARRRWQEGQRPSGRPPKPSGAVRFMRRPKPGVHAARPRTRG